MTGPRTYGEFAVDCLRSDLGFYRDVDNKWVVIYQSVDDASGPLYLRMKKGGGWGAGGINDCTLFDTYEDAVAGAEQSAYIMKLPWAMKRIVQLKLKVDVQIDIVEDRPIGVLDALAEA